MYEDALARIDLFSGLRKKELKEVAYYLGDDTKTGGLHSNHCPLYSG